MSSESPQTEQLLSIESAAKWQELLRGGSEAPLARELPGHLPTQRWFRSKARPIRATSIRDVVPLPGKAGAVLALVEVHYEEGDAELYSLPLALAIGAAAERVTTETPALIVCCVVIVGGGERAILYQPLADNEVAGALLSAVREGRLWQGHAGQVVARSTSALAPQPDPAERPVRLVGVEQSNTSLVFGDRWILKLYRQLEEGLNPDLEIGRFLVERAPGAPVPPVAGWLEYVAADGRRSTLALLQRFAVNRGDAWAQSQAAVSRYLEQSRSGDAAPPLPRGTLIEQATGEPDATVRQAMGDYLERAALLGQRVAELHLALSSAPDDPVFAPQPLSRVEQQYLEQGMLALASRTLGLLRSQRDRVPPDLAPRADLVLQSEQRLHECFQRLGAGPIGGQRIRHHGDLHLGQILVIGSDFAFIDFEGEPARPLAERRAKQSPLRDVAGMLRSFHYAAFAPLLCRADIDRDAAKRAEPWAAAWQSWSSSSFLHAYLRAAKGARFLPPDEERLNLMLEVLVLEKAVYELSYELNNRPSWLGIPLDAIARIISP